MESHITGLSTLDVRYVRRARTQLCRPFTGADMDDVELDYIAQAVLNTERDDNELVLIAMDREERRYLAVGHIAAICNWIVAQEPKPAPSQHRAGRCNCCHRALTDDVSRRRGYGPTCWEKVMRGVA